MFKYSTSQLIVIPIMYVLMFLISLLIRYLLIDKSKNIRRIPVIVVTITLLVFEVIKQTYLLSLNKWTTWSLPFHFCSSLYIWFSIASFSKREKIQKIGFATSFIGSLLLWILFLGDPTSIVGGAIDNPVADFEAFHTFIFHFLSMIVWQLILCLELLDKPTHKTAIISTLSYLVFYVIVTIAAYGLKVNYISVFESVIPFLENLRLKYGQVVYTTVLYIIGIALPPLILYGYLLVLKIIKSLRKSSIN